MPGRPGSRVVGSAGRRGTRRRLGRFVRREEGPNRRTAREGLKSPVSVQPGRARKAQWHRQFTRPSRGSRPRGPSDSVSPSAARVSPSRSRSRPSRPRGRRSPRWSRTTSAPTRHEYVEIDASPGASARERSSRSSSTFRRTRLVELDGSPGGDPGKILHVFTPTTDERRGVLVDGLPELDARAAVVHDPPRLGLHGCGGGRPRRRRRRLPRRGPLDVRSRRRRLLRRRRGRSTYATPVLGPGFDGERHGAGRSVPLSLLAGHRRR